MTIKRMWKKWMNLNKGFLLLLVLGVGCLSCGNQGYKVVVYYSGIVDSMDVYLRYADTSRQIIDSFRLDGQPVQFKGESPSVRRVEIVCGKKQRIPFFLENGIISVVVSGKNVKVSGTNSNDLWGQFLGEEEWIDRELEELYKVYGDYLQNKNTDRACFDRGIQLTVKMDSLNRQKVMTTLRFIRENGDTEVAAYCLQKIVPYLTKDEIREAVSSLSARVQSSVAGKAVLPLVRQAELSAVGSVLPDYVLQTPVGEQQSLHEWIGKGDYVLLEFWASWCGPCKKEIPHLQKVLEKYGDKNFKIVGISMDTDVVAWKEAIGQHGIFWPQLSDLKGFSGNLPQLFRVRGIPTCILVNPEGRIIHRTARGSWLDRFLIAEWGDLF